MSKKEFSPDDLYRRDEVIDRLRGGPRQKMNDLAQEIDMSYDDLMNQLHQYIKSNGSEGIFLGVDIPYDDVSDMWGWYELITRTVVPTSIRENPFSCSC